MRGWDSMMLLVGLPLCHLVTTTSATQSANPPVHVSSQLAFLNVAPFSHGSTSSRSCSTCREHRKVSQVMPASAMEGVEEDMISRKDLAGQAAVALAALLASPSIAASTDNRTVLLTGASSGIGLDAAKKLVDLGHDVHLVCRTEAKAKEAVAATGATGGYACDLSSLKSVRAFVKTWGGKPIDSLCLNAGMAPATKGTVGYTQDGFELSVGTNHLGHFLLANLMIKSLESGALNHPRLVVTASSVHDPDTPGGDVGSKATLGDLSGLEAYLTTGRFDMVDGGEYDGDKSYKDSKLCNVLFTLEAQRRLSLRGSRVLVDCFSPGLITSTGLFRNQNAAFVKAFDFAATNILKVAASVSQGGNTLVQMAQDSSIEHVPGGQFFATTPGKPSSAFAPQQASVEARDATKGKLLWDLSAKCVGIDSSTPI